MQPGLLALVQWLSPAFPTGAFAYSHGLEVAIADGRINNSETLGAWLGTILSHGSGWQDAVLLNAGLEADSHRFEELGTVARALQPGSARLTETSDQGRAFAQTVSALAGTAQPSRPLPLAVAAAARPLALPRADVIALYLHGFASNLVTIAVRAVPLGQTEGQKLLASLHPRILSLAEQASTSTLEDLGSAAFASDLASMTHETLQPRLFRT